MRYADAASGLVVRSDRSPKKVPILEVLDEQGLIAAI